MDTFLPLIKAWKQKGITKTHKMLKKKLIQKKVCTFSNWTIDGAQH